VIIKGIRNAHLPTTVLNANIPLSITEWIAKVPDYQHRTMFLQITEVNNDELELRCLETNLHIAKKWARNALHHIAKVLKPMQFTSAFTDFDIDRFHLSDTEPWNPPPPPAIKFVPDPNDVWKKDIPKTITKSDNKQQHKRRSNNTTNDHEYDNNTTTTVNTQASYTQDTISELQNNSYQHQQMMDTHAKRLDAIDKKIEKTENIQRSIDEHTSRIEKNESENATLHQRLLNIDTQMQEKLSKFTSNLATLEEEQQIQQRHQEQLTEDVARCSSQLPTITETLEQQQQQLIKYFKRQNKINKQSDAEIKKLRATQESHQKMIATLQAIVLSLQSNRPSTPLSQQRIRKRLKPRTPNETSIREDSDMGSDDNSDELHQLHAITTLQSQSLEQISFIAHQSMDDSTIEDDRLINWDDISIDNEESLTNFSLVETQIDEEEQDDPGHQKPGSDT
jgi:DNA repair exonuclease SbcCD ATPase subunit